MSRYSKFNSSYILRKQHQTIDGGVIIERDWTTIGERHNIAPGKKRVSYDGNFLFTENTQSMAYRKAAASRWVGSYDYDDVKDATEAVNRVELNTTTDNPLFFVYYGSLYTQFEGAIVDIIRFFPGNIRFGNTPFKPLLKDYRFPEGMSQIRNEFEINFISQPKNLTKYDNELRYMSLSWDKYVVVVDGVEKGIVGYSVENKQTGINAIESVYIGDGELFKYDGRYYKYDKSTGQYIDIDIVESDNYFVKCNEYIKHKDDYYKWSDEENMYKKLPIDKVCNSEVYHMYDVNFCTKLGDDGVCDEEEVYKIGIYRLYDVVVFVNEITEHTIEIRPRKDVIEAYFASLDGLEGIMLNRKMNPNYSFDMTTCETDDMGNVSLKKLTMAWPKDEDGYCIRIDGILFEAFTDALLASAENYDLHYSDNIWRSMTHEAIKNYDWSYERDSEDVDLVDNAIGSNVVCSILRLIGMEFDELKNYIDGITNSNKLTYDGFLNMPDSEVVTQVENGGFDAVSTIWHQNEYVEIPESEIPENVTPNNYFAIPSTSDVLDDYISVGCEGSEHGMHFYKRTSTIGDEVRLDYAFFNPDAETDYRIGKLNPWIASNYSGYGYRRIAHLPAYVTDDYWSDRNTYSVPPTVGSRFSPRFARVITSGGYDYYEKVSSFADSDYVHSTWFDRLDPNYFSQSVVDIDVMRRLGLSCRNIFATKGTAHAIDMVMGVFGFGRNDDDSLSDYKLIESYHELGQIPYDEDFWYYEQLEEEPLNTSYPPSATFALLPLHATDNDSVFPVDIRVDDGFGGYSYFRKNKMKAYEMANAIYTSMSLTGYEDAEYPGFPLATTYINGNKCFVPFVSGESNYHGEIYFQSKGGWCKKSSLNSGIYDWEETVPYIKSVNTPANLLDADGLYNVGDYVYVKYPLDHNDSFIINPAHVSNYFKLVDTDVENPLSWRNIPIDGPIMYDNYVPPTDADEHAPTHQDFLNAKFIDEIIFTNKGNNPHAGNGKYDAGEDYLSFIRLPFKYAVDNPETSFYSNADLTLAKQFAFSLSGRKYLSQKSFVHLFPYVYEQMEEEPDFEDGYWTSLNTFDSIPSVVYPSSPTFIRISTGGTYTYFKKTKGDDALTKYLINSKVLIMRNLNNNTLYKRYFNSIILPYLLQVIPSTTIFVLENFDECDVDTGVYYNIRATVGGDGCGAVSGSGKYFECDYAVLTATPGENCHFVEWRLVDCETNAVIQTEMDMTAETIMPKVVGDACYVAVFEYNCTIAMTNGVLHCNNAGYSDDVVYGRIMYNDDMELRPGNEYVIDEAVGQFHFTAYPIEGYSLDSWHIFDGGEDVTETLIGNGCIDIRTVGGDMVLSVNDKKCICGCKVAPLFSPNEYTVSVDISCPCDDSSVDMSDPEICNPVEIWFSCCRGTSDFCCQGSEFVYRVNGGLERTWTFDDFDTPVVVERGSTVRVSYQSTIDCCKFKGIKIDGTPYQRQDVVFVAENNIHYVCGELDGGEARLGYEVACCEGMDNLFEVSGFYIKSTQTPTVRCNCGDDVRFVCDVHNSCLRLDFTVNGVRYQPAYEQGSAYIEIQDVDSDIHVKVGVDLANVPTPVFDTPVLGETELEDNCYVCVFNPPDCADCSNVCFDLHPTGHICSCACKYTLTGWEYRDENNDWQLLPTIDNCMSFADYLSLVENAGCRQLHIRAVFALSELCVRIEVNGQRPSNFSVTCGYDGQQTKTILPGRQECFERVDDGQFIVNSNIGGCDRIENVDLQGCGTMVFSPGEFKTFGIDGTCGNITLTYTFSSVDAYTVNVIVYDFETGNPTNHSCALVSDSETPRGDVAISSSVECGGNYTFDVVIEKDSCCTRIDRILDNNVDITNTMHGNIIELQNVRENHEIRVYVVHPIYNVTIVYKPSSTCTETSCSMDRAIGCLQVNCIDSLSCTTDLSNGTKTCEYMCGITATFSETHVCCNSSCCEYVFTAEEYEYGLASGYDFSNRTWNSGANYRSTSNLSDVRFSETKDQVVVVRYCCSSRSETLGPTMLTVEPIEYSPEDGSFKPFGPNTGCLDYTHSITGTKACEIDNILTAGSNDCWEFVGWYVFDSVTGYSLASTEEEYHYCACESETIYAAFKAASQENHTITARLVILEQNMQPFNEDMHDSQYANAYDAISQQFQTFSGECGTEHTFTFNNIFTQYFSMQGLYIEDSFTSNLNPALYVDVAAIEGERNNEEYKFTVSSCGNVNYVLVLVPTDYMTFYNPDYLSEPEKTVSFKMGYYDTSGMPFFVLPTDQYLPTVTYWDGSSWTNVNLGINYKFEASANDFFMVRIDTPEIGQVKVGNYIPNASEKMCAKIEINISNSNKKYGISGSILSLCYGSSTTTVSNLPDYFAKEIFKFNNYTSRKKPGNIFGYAFRKVGNIGEYAMYDMFDSTNNRCTSDFVMLDNVGRIGNYGCSKLFANATLSGVSVSTITYIGKHACEDMFNGCNRIENDLEFTELANVNDYGCKGMFQSADGRNSPYIVPSYPINVTFPSLSHVGNNSFEFMFAGCQLMEISLEINGSNPVNYSHGNDTSSTFHQAFSGSGIVAADISSVLVPRIYDGTTYYNNCFFEHCFSGASNLSTLNVGCNFAFERQFYSSAYIYTTESWLLGAGNGNATFLCSSSCSNSITSEGGPDYNTVPSSGWTVSTTICQTTTT